MLQPFSSILQYWSQYLSPAEIAHAPRLPAIAAVVHSRSTFALFSDSSILAELFFWRPSCYCDAVPRRHQYPVRPGPHICARSRGPLGVQTPFASLVRSPASTDRIAYAACYGRPSVASQSIRSRPMFRRYRGTLRRFDAAPARIMRNGLRLRSPGNVRHGKRQSRVPSLFSTTHSIRYAYECFRTRRAARAWCPVYTRHRPTRSVKSDDSFRHRRPC